jgi:hypothetical protein
LRNAGEKNCDGSAVQNLVQEPNPVGADTPLLEDRVLTRSWELDLSAAGKVRPSATKPSRRKQQQIARFEKREGTIERFSFRQTIPHPQHEAFSPPSQLQYGAVSDFFG